MLLYSPFVYVSIGLFSRTASREVFSPLQSLTSVFGMGTGGPSAFMTLTLFQPLLGRKALKLSLSRFSRYSCTLKIEQQIFP